jgi:putative ABC transport system permease protein
MLSLDKKLLRELWKIKGQVLAVTSVIACGITMYIAFYSAFLNLELSRDTYYAKYRFHDFSIQMEKAPLNSVFKIQNLPGVRAVSGRVVKDVTVSLKDKDELIIGRIIGLDSRKKSIIDNIHLVSGRLLTPGETNVCLVDDKFLKANKLNTGDFITVTLNGRKQNLKIIGTAMSPEFIYAIRNAFEIIANPEKFGIIWVNDDWIDTAFNMKGFYNEIIGEVYEQDNLDNILDSAGKILDSYGVYSKVKRKDQISNFIINSKIDGIKGASKTVPVIFLMIASVILLIVISRLVKRERTFIGLLKAYGYTNLEISFHYIKFASVIGLIGGLMGIAFGEWLSFGLINIYAQSFTFPELQFKFYTSSAVIGVLISLTCSLISALIAVEGVVKIMPATAMKESISSLVSVKTPFERIKIVWDNVSFTNKIILRNVWRYPFRSAFTAVGVMLSTTILFLGYFMNDSMGFLVDYQFNKIQKEDIKITFYLERNIKAFYEALRFPNIKKAEPMLLYPFELKNKWHIKQSVIYGLKKQPQLFGLINSDGKEIEAPSYGILLSERIARELDVKKGSKLIIKPLMGKIDTEKEVIVAGTIKLYMGDGAYMNIDTLSNLLGNSTILNSILLKVDSPQDIPELNKIFKDIPAISSVELKKDVIDNFSKNIANSLSSMNVIFTIFAGIIAIAVIYNSTVINITEREREIASLQVLGFTESEVGRIVFNENIWLSLIGMFLGLPAGYLLCKVMTATVYNTDLFRLPFYVSNRTYIICAFTMTFFVFMTNMYMKKRIAKIDLVEVLKTRE